MASSALLHEERLTDDEVDEIRAAIRRKKEQEALLMQELRVLNSRINVQIEAIKRVVENKPGGPANGFEAQYSDGKFIMPELLAAQAQVLNAQAVLLASKVR